MKRLILYDLDGTLVDTREDLVRAVEHMLQALGEAPRSRQQVLNAVGRGLRHLVTDCLSAPSDARVEQGIRVFTDYYGQHLADHSRLYPGASEVLEHFKARTQAVITNKPNPFARELLVGLGVAGYFAQIVAGDAGYPKKPDPAALTALMAQHRATAAQAVFIGDSVIDVETGRRAGVFTVAMSHGLEAPEVLAHAGPDALVRDFRELLALAKRRRW